MSSKAVGNRLMKHIDEPGQIWRPDPLFEVGAKTARLSRCREQLQRARNMIRIGHPARIHLRPVYGFYGFYGFYSRCSARNTDFFCPIFPQNKCSGARTAATQTVETVETVEARIGSRSTVGTTRRRLRMRNMPTTFILCSKDLCSSPQSGTSGNCVRETWANPLGSSSTNWHSTGESAICANRLCLGFASLPARAPRASTACD